jgi:hypothetical protein
MIKVNRSLYFVTVFLLRKYQGSTVNATTVTLTKEAAIAAVLTVLILGK